MDKSHVTLEQHACIVCLELYDTGNLLLDTQLKKRFERHTTTGFGMCPAHKEQADAGYIALIEVDERKSDIRGGSLKSQDAWRTGNVAHLRETVWEKIFGAPPPRNPDGSICRAVFVQDGVINKLREITKVTDSVTEVGKENVNGKLPKEQADGEEES